VFAGVSFSWLGFEGFKNIKYNFMRDENKGKITQKYIKMRHRLFNMGVHKNTKMEQSLF